MEKTVDIFNIWYNEYSSDNTCKLAGFTSRDVEGDIVIPETIDGKKVTKLGFIRNYPKITSITMPDTVEEILMIKDCESLKKIVFSKKLEKIRACGFSNSLEDVVLVILLKK